MANQFELAVVEEVETQTFHPPAYLDKKNLTPDDFIARFSQWLPLYIGSGHPTVDTLATYETSINLYLKWCREANLHPFAARDEHIRLYRYFLDSKQKLSPSSIRLKLIAIKAFYSIAIKLELLKQNPCEDIDLPRMNKANDDDFKYYSVEQIGEICNTFLTMEPLMCARNQLIVFLMGIEGLRRVEIMRLNDEDIDWQNKRIWIRGKGKGDFIYPCDASMEKLSVYLERRGPVEKEQNDFTPTIISLSHRSYGRRISRLGVYEIVNRALEWAGVKYPGHACHTLRHSCGTNLYRNTKDIRLVQETLRHSSPNMTARYAHVSDRAEKRATRNIVPTNVGDSQYIK